MPGPRRSSRRLRWLAALMLPPVPPTVMKVICLVAIVAGAALMLPALVVACMALVTWNPIAAGYAVIWATLWFIAVPLLGLGIYAWRSASSRSNRRA